jgi:hypothetical protein
MPDSSRMNTRRDTWELEMPARRRRPRRNNDEDWVGGLLALGLGALAAVNIEMPHSPFSTHRTHAAVLTHEEMIY